MSCGRRPVRPPLAKAHFGAWLCKGCQNRALPDPRFDCSIKPMFNSQKLEIDFLEDIKQLIDGDQVALERIINMDQTPAQVVMPEKWTNDVVGTKDIIVNNPPGEKDHYTITLAVRPTGEKLPAVIVFRGAAATGVLYKQQLDNNG